MTTRVGWAIGVLAFLISVNMNGQVPGYLGKRLFVEAQIGAISGMEASPNGVSSKNLIRPSFGATLNWVSSRHKYLSLGLVQRYYYDNFGKAELLPGRPNLDYRTSHRTYSLGLHIMAKTRNSSASLAPLGRTLGFHVFYSQIQPTPLRYSDTGEPFEFVERAAYNLIYYRPNVNYWGLAFSLGNRIVLKDRYTFRTLFDIGFSVTSSGDHFSEKNERIVAFNPSLLEQYEKVYIQLSVGFGVLLF